MPTIDELAAQLASGGVSAEAWLRWFDGDAPDAAVVRDAAAVTEALVRGQLDREGYQSRMTALWEYWRGRLETLPPDAEESGGG